MSWWYDDRDEEDYVFILFLSFFLFSLLIFFMTSPYDYDEWNMDSKILFCNDEVWNRCAIRVHQSETYVPCFGHGSSQLDQGGLMRLLFFIPHGFSLHCPPRPQSKLAILETTPPKQCPVMCRM